MRCLVTLALWVVASSALAGAPDYDAFSEPDGEIATVRQELAAWSMLRDPEQLDVVYADAAKGMPRAVHVVQQLEATLAASGREVAERSSRPGCLVPGYKELSGTCRPDWSFLDFLSKDRPGGIRLREVIFGAFAARARERGLENGAVLAAVNGLLSLELARGVLLEAETAARLPKTPRVAPAPVAPRPAMPEPQAQAAGGGPKLGSADPTQARKAFPRSVKEQARAESGGKCVFCGTKTTDAPGPTKSEIDHALPKSRGGDNTLNNAQNTCRTCNRAKGTKTTEEFLE